MHVWYFLGVSLEEGDRLFTNFFLTFSYSLFFLTAVFFFVLSVWKSFFATFREVKAEVNGPEGEESSLKLFQFKFFYRSWNPCLILLRRY